MLTRSGRHSPTGRDRERRDADDLSAYGAILDEHEKHVFDYCSRLVGDEAAAASATETAMVAAQSLLADPDRLRAWLFALARQDIAAKIQPSDQNQDAEILDLVYRHGIRPGDLPAVLGVPPEHASAMLASAQALADAEAEAGAEAEVDPSTDTDAAGEADASAVAYAPAEIDGRAEDMLASPDEPGEVGEVGPGWAPGGDPRPDSGSVEAFTALFDAYARHVYDYCGSLLGDQAAAADATQVTLTVACMLVARLDSHFRVRAWLLALARAACKSTDPGRREEPLPSDRLGLSELLGSRHHAGDEIANTGQGELNSDADVSEGPEGPVLATLSRLPAEQREVLELVYRHGVRPAELPAVLAISADHAQTLLTEAVRSFEQSSWFRADAAEEPGPEVVSWRPGIEQLASVPLASLPDSLLGHTFRAVFDPGAGSHRAAVLTRLGPFGPDGFPRQQTPSVDPPGRRHIIAPLLLGAMLLVLAAAGAAVYYYFSSSPDALARSHSRVLASHPATNPPSPSQAGPHQIRLHHHRTHLKAHSFASAPPPAPSPAPQPSQSSPAPRITKPGPHSSPSPTEHPSPSSTPSSSLSPTPSQSSP